MKIKCVVACRNANGVPDFFPCTVEATPEEYDDGEHYKAALDLAAEHGYQPELAYDENDGPPFLFDHYFPGGLTVAERIRDVLYRDGPDTQWTPDTLDQVAEVLRSAGLAPE